MKNFNKTGLILLILSSIAIAGGQPDVGSRFSYQGQLQDNGTPANGLYDMRFEIYSNLSGGADLGTLDVDDVDVSNGLFNTELDFGDAIFNGDELYLEISIENLNSSGYSVLTPRQRINTVPYAIQAEFVKNGSTQWEDISGGIRYLDDVTIGTLSTSSPSKVTIATNSATEPLRARIGGDTKFLVAANGGTAIGINNTTPPANGLYVEGDTELNGDLELREDIKQDIENNGVLKAGLVVICSTNPSSIIRSFNGVDGQSFSINGTIGTGTGVCAIDFPFSLDGRYFVAMVNSTTLTSNRNVACGVTASTTLVCSVLDNSGAQANAVIHILVY